MAEPRPDAHQLLTPKRVFGGLAALLLVTLLFAPSREPVQDIASLSSYAASPSGTRGLHDLLDRLGFSVERRLRPMRQALEPKAVYVVLEPPVELTALEVHNLLAAVHAGAGLLVLPGRYSRLADSLHLDRVPAQPLRRENDGPRADSLARFGQGWVRFVLRKPTRERDSTIVFQPPAGAITFLSFATRRGNEPVMVGLPFGEGRIVIAADPDFFHNALVRQGDAAVRAVRLIEWLTAGDRARAVVFDEYHHGFGMHADIMRVTRRALFATGPGRAVLQLGLAGLFLLLALGVRPIPPRARTRIERRSALEHVGALARAYAAVHATERATRLLVRGVRRRHGGLSGHRDEAAYLRAIAERKPAVAHDVQQVVSAMEGTTAPGSDAALTAALRRIEAAVAP